MKLLKELFANMLGQTDQTKVLDDKETRFDFLGRGKEPVVPKKLPINHTAKNKGKTQGTTKQANAGGVGKQTTKMKKGTMKFGYTGKEIF